MATKAAIAVIREVAMSRIELAMNRISEVTNVPAVTLPEFRDPLYQEAAQMEALSKWAFSLAQELNPMPEAEPEPEVEETPDAFAEFDDEQLYRMVARDSLPPTIYDRQSLIDMLNQLIEMGFDVFEPLPEPESEDGEIEVDEDSDVEIESAEYGVMTVAELKELAEQREINITGLRLKSELVDALQAADGLTEEEQAAEDGVDAEIDQ